MKSLRPFRRTSSRSTGPTQTARLRDSSTDSLNLLRQARERLGHGLRAVEADVIAESDEISLRSQRPR